MFVTHRCSYHDFFKLKENECFWIKKKSLKNSAQAYNTKANERIRSEWKQISFNCVLEISTLQNKIEIQKIVCEIHISMDSDDTIVVDGRCNFY